MHGDLLAVAPRQTDAEAQSYAYGSNLDVAWDEDPRMLGIRLARYKFVAKMFAGYSRVVEIGAGTGFLSRVVDRAVQRLVLTEAHPTPAMRRFNPAADDPRDMRGVFDGAYALDVLEHVAPEQEDAWLRGVKACLREDGACIVGCPSLESQAYASRISVASHVNCKTEDGFRGTLQRHFRNVFVFGMNDEVIHTGFGPMCHYRLALCLGARDEAVIPPLKQGDPQ